MIQSATPTATDMEERIDALLQSLTLDEQVSLLAGADFWTTVPIERVGVPAIKLTDGPNGARAGGFNTVLRGVPMSKAGPDRRF